MLLISWSIFQCVLVNIIEKGEKNSCLLLSPTRRAQKSSFCMYQKIKISILQKTEQPLNPHSYSVLKYLVAYTEDCLVTVNVISVGTVYVGMVPTFPWCISLCKEKFPNSLTHCSRPFLALSHPILYCNCSNQWYQHVHM